ncbi:MAG: hypothetical protein ACOX05_04625 [Bacillota bacterium]|jgi:hypothetical protein
MRKKLLSWILTLGMVLSLFVAMPLTASATDPGVLFNGLEGTIYQNESTSGVYNNPQVATTFEVTEPTLITGIRNYHWDTSPVNEYESATFKLVHSDSTEYGPWSVVAGPGSGRENVYWYAFPNEIIKPGLYTLIDSNNATWSWTGNSGGKGHSCIKGVSSSGDYIVNDLVIEDAIAPINEGTPVTTIESDQYTGTIDWAGTTQFVAGTQYTATIQLTAKPGYTFEGVAANSFKIPCAMSATNDANSGVIVATFISPPNGYITDGNGVMAYRYNEYDSYSFDIRGFYHNSWKQTTCGSGGYYTRYNINDEYSGNISGVSGSPTEIPSTTLTLNIDLNFVSNGQALQIAYIVKNVDENNDVTGVSFGSYADVQIGSDDRAVITVFDPEEAVAENRGFKMVSNNIQDRKEVEEGQFEYAQFNFFGKYSVGVTDVDTF